jgi:Flp pilus assembly protein TadG
VSWRRLRHDRGSATAELAVGLPALVLLLFTAITAVGAVTTKLRCVDAARDAALSAARGGEAGRGPAPDDAVVSVTVNGDEVVATVRAPVRPLGAHLPELAVVATAVAAVEPGVPEPAP